MANTSIDLVGLDFQTIKTNLKTYLKNNTAFKDVDFEGSNINTLIDLLSYNTYLNSFYTNMVASEMFIDTAQLRDSVVSHAKSLNYTPRSFVSASAEVKLTIAPSSPVTNIVIPKGTTFTSRVGSNTYTFSTSATEVINTSNNGVFTANVMLYEGSYIADSFTMNYSNTSQRFVLSNPTVDTSSISVTVIEDGGSNSLSYVKTETLIGLTSSTRAYFVEAAENQQYELKFGDNIFGRKPRDGSVIVVEYRTSSGELPNGASVFLNDGNIDTHSNVLVSTISNATGGAVNETVESIRYNAPRNFQVQGRAVTTSDYETILKANFGDIQSISAYGGETLTPPQFGKVFVSVDVKNADGTPQNRIKTFSDFIKDKTPVSVDVVFVDPQFMYVKVNSEVKYNINATTKLSNDIKSSVLAKISNFNNTHLEGFKKTVYYTQLTKEIDSADPSIVSNDTEIKAIKIINPKFNTNQSFEINFGFKIQTETGVVLNVPEYHYGHSVQSSPFLFNGKRSILVDNTQGTLYVAKLIGGVAEVVKIIGSVDYVNGIVYINNLNITSYEGDGIKVYVRSNAKDFSSSKNVILAIKDEDVTVTVTPVKL
jgi:hypothetical protein